MPSELYFDKLSPIYIGNVEGDVYVNVSPAAKSPPPSLPGGPVRGGAGGLVTGGMKCTKDVRQCPDGSYVTRRGPNCTFAPCPSSPVAEAIGKINQDNLDARISLVTATAKEWLVGAGMGIVAMESAIRERINQSAVEAAGKSLGEIANIPTFRVFPLPNLRITLTVSPDEASPPDAVERFYRLYRARIDPLSAGGPVEYGSGGSVRFQMDPNRIEDLRALVEAACNDPGVGALVLLSDSRPAPLSPEQAMEQLAASQAERLVQESLASIACPPPGRTPPCDTTPSGLARPTGKKTWIPVGDGRLACPQPLFECPEVPQPLLPDNLEYRCTGETGRCIPCIRGIPTGENAVLWRNGGLKLCSELRFMTLPPPPGAPPLPPSFPNPVSLADDDGPGGTDGGPGGGTDGGGGYYDGDEEEVDCPLVLPMGCPEGEASEIVGEQTDGKCSSPVWGPCKPK